MFRTKLEVDRHVENCLKKINNENERNQRCYSFAKLYFGVGDYEQARRYVSSYLSVKPKSAEGHYLLGKALEKLGKKEAALDAFRNSLQLDPKQNSLVIKVCELLASDDVNMDQSGARYFCEMAQSFDPHNPAVFSLKERLIVLENKSPEEISKLLLKELEDRPSDLNLRIRLIKHYLQNQQIKEAYSHVFEVENKNISIFLNSLSWHEVVAEVLIRYQRDTSLNTNLNWEFWFLSVSVLDKLVMLSLDETSNTHKVSSEYVSTIFNFDQTLQKASENINSCPDRQFSQEFLNHYSAQLCFHIATLTFKQAKKDYIKYKEASYVTLPVMLAAYHTSPADLQSMWLSNITEVRKNMVQRWHREASFRCSQVGHILLGLAKNRKTAIVEKAMQYSSGIWREQLFKKLFIIRDQQIKINRSFFVTTPQLLEITYRFPEINELLVYDEHSQLMFPDSLHHYVWIALNQKLPDLKLKPFEGLPYSTKNLNNCAAESLSVLDVQAFIDLSTLCAQRKAADLKNSLYNNGDKPSVLPALISDLLVTANQTKFLKAAYRLYKKDYSIDFSELRLILVKGIEVVRCIGHHGLNVKLLVMLASTFAERAKKSTKQSEIEFNDARAELYWKTALPMLEKLKNNQAISYSSNTLFEYKFKEMSQNEIYSYIEKAKLFTGTQLMKKKDYEKALQIFEGLKDPYASFYQAQIYKQMADEISTHTKENVTSEMRSQNIIILSRARDCLYLTLDRLREPSVERNHSLNKQLGTEIENIENLLSRIDPDCINRNECDGMSDENVSSADSAGDHYVTSYSLQQSYLTSAFNPRLDHTNIQSTPVRREARPSPERLDAQLRQLAASKDASISHILEQNKVMVDSHRSLVEELRSFKDAVHHLTNSVDELKSVKHGFEELKEIKQSVDELKVSVDELQSFKHISDIVQEMKKEIADLRRESKNPLSEEDLHILDGEYGSEYNMTPSIPGYNPNLYPNYQGRLAAPNTLPYGALYPGMYSPMAAAYAYGGMGLPQPAGPLSFTTEQQMAADYRAMSALNQVPPGVNYGITNHNQPVIGQPLAQAALPPTSLNIGLLTGQGLSLTSNSYMFKDNKLPPVTFASTSQNILQTTSATASPVMSNTVASNKAPPVNVVITSSDPLPTNTSTVPQQQLSVTIPPQHLKGNIPFSKPHNYQIPLPNTSLTTTTTPSILSKPAPIVSIETLLSNVAPPVFSAIGDKSPQKNISLGLQIEKSLNTSFGATKNNTSDLNKSNISSSSIEEHDPCPDFKPIIPLPDEVPLNTGEENEVVIFAERAKLYRHTVVNDNKEWRERGVGVLKILCNPATGKVRLLMRRDQIHKICANHFLSNDMKLTLMPKSDRAYIWAAKDYADEKLISETLCVKFKTAEEAKKFYEAFESAKKGVPASSNNKNKNYSISEKDKPNVHTPDIVSKTSSLGGFNFTSTPTFKPTTNVTPVKSLIEDQPVKLSPFSDFTFNASKQQTFDTKKMFSGLNPVGTDVDKFKPAKAAEADSNTGADDVEEFEPTVEFAPVIPLPSIVEVKTGEENTEVLFESRAKLLRFDTSGEENEWKDRGVGTFKILKDCQNDTIRLIMRRDQVHKVCCNHQLLKNMVFKKMTNNSKAVTWCAQDFSEGVVKPETFAIRFKTEDLAENFYKTITSSQTSLNDQNNVNTEHTEKHIKSDTSTKSSIGFGDKFKSAKGSWECKNCYIVNEGKTNYCVACETPKNDTIAPKSSTNNSSGPNFSFGINPKTTNTTFSFGTPTPSNVFQVKADSTTTDNSVLKTEPTASWGNAFKPKEGTWECKQCYIRNEAEKENCVSCESPKNPDAKTSNTNKPQPVEMKFTFGIPDSSKNITTKPEDKTSSSKQASGWDKALKQNEGTWECKSCYIRNKPDVKYCVSCESPKDNTVPSKDKQVSTQETTGQKFIFGIPNASSTTIAPKNTFTFGQSSTQFTFGGTNTQSQTSTTTTSSPFTFTPAATTKIDDKKPGEQFVFGSPQKHDFGFTPRSPRRISGQGDEESDGSYNEEDSDHIYFKPIIPLPDKVDVKTGEEQEVVLYCHRSKLYRFVDGEWKERGVGDVKILKNPATQKVRVVMRREQVLKICLNHILTPDIEYLPKDDKTWLFSAADFSEGEINRQQFCIRFKTPDIAEEFKKAISDAVADLDSSNTDNKTTTNDSDVEIISETKVTPEEEQEAIKLGLPPKFMSYRQLPDCNCSQCKKDDQYLNNVSEKPKTPSIWSSPATANSSLNSFSFISPIISPAGGDSKAGSTMLKNLLNQPSKLSTPVSNIDNSNKSPLLKQPVFTTPGTTTDNTNKPLIKQPVFASPATTASSIFGSNNSIFSTISTPSDSKTNISITKAGNLFGSKTNLSTASIFATTTASSESSAVKTFSFTNSSNLFGATTTSSVIPTTGSIFGNAVEGVFGTSGGSVFGNISKPTTTSSIFGSLTTTSTASPFGSNTATSTGSIFGGQPILFEAGKSFGTPKLQQTNESNSAATPTFGSFGSANKGQVQFSFGSVQASPEKTTTLTEDDEVVLKCDNNLSFASLAANTSTSSPVFAKKSEQEEVPFAFLGAGRPVFGGKKEIKNKEDKNVSVEEVEGAGGEDAYDPHYEPIIPLPDAIEVHTGEEEEVALFNERAKLYRYSIETKEWKERGVGQFKILHHPINNTYRFLLRREQVYKVVLNQLITPELDMQPMTTSDKAWMWAGYNYTEDEQGLEKLAVRFKNCTLAQQFYAAAQHAITAAKYAKENKLPSSIENYGVEDVSNDSADTAVYENEEDYEEDLDEEDEDERSVMFMKHCILSEQVPNGNYIKFAEGDLQVYYDPELYAARISVNDEDNQVSNTMIGMNTEMALEGKDCYWQAVEWATDKLYWRRLKATFENEEAAQEFHSNYLEGLSYAQQCDIIDELRESED